MSGGREPEVITFGCRLNAVESDTMLRHAKAAGLGDAIIVNSCAVTAEAERQTGQAIRRLRRERPGARIIVTGCAAQIDRAKFAAMKEVDAVIGNDDKLKPESFAALGDGRALAPMPPVADLAAMQRAFVQVQNGCDHDCTFCIIPFGRGASRSLPVDEVIARMRQQTELGFNEIVLTGVDIASYGRENGGVSLGALIRAVLAAVPNLPRLRLSSLDPAVFNDDLWDALANEPRLMPHLHLSLQAGDDMILKRMKRRHSRDDVLRLCDRARSLRPDIVFGADIIAGFPTETDAMFENTYELVERCGLTWLHVFPYSARKGTPAARMPQVPGEVRRLRAERLRTLGEAAAARYDRNLDGQKLQVLVENNGFGCTPHFGKLQLEGEARVGHIVEAACALNAQGRIIGKVGRP
jgi:threonylcarbamoyladenosine tRNA methylthiotransferase MtaB